MVAVLMASGAAVPAGAEEEAAPPEKPIVTDRPTDSASPELVPRRTLQFETGYKFTHTEDGSVRTDTHELPDLLVRFGLGERVEARLSATGWTFRDGSANDDDGFNDVSLGTKIALGEARGLRPQTALLAELSVPVGDSAFTDDYVIPKVLLLAAHGLTDRLGLTWNLGPSLVTTRTDGRKQMDVTLNYAVALSGTVRGPVSLFGEVFGNFASGRDQSDSHTMQAGTTVLLTPTLQFDLRAGYGLVDGVPDWLAGAGLAFRFGRSEPGPKSDRTTTTECQ